VEEGAFRADLFYRLNVLRIYLPPLRERPEDVPILIRRFVKDYSQRHERPFRGISSEAMQLLVEYAWPGNVRELRNLIESMVVLAPDHEIQPGDLPRHIREGGSARLLPVHVGPIVRGQERTAGRELEFIVRSLLELRLQVEDLRRQVEGQRIGEVVPEAERVEASHPFAGWIGEGTLTPPAPQVEEASTEPAAAAARPAVVAAIPPLEPPDQPLPPATITVTAGTKMAEVERAMIEATLKETRGNRRRAAELLGIGERTLYRKIREYRVPEYEYVAE